MNTEIRKSEKTELHDKLQSGQLVIGLSSAIPGFIKKSPANNAISFAPFFIRDRWVDLPIAIIQELVPAPNSQMLKEHLPLSFALKPGEKKERVLMDIIDVLTKPVPTRANGTGMIKATGSAPLSSSENGICRKCSMGDEFCVDCYLAL
jgi:hypothetical protein